MASSEVNIRVFFALDIQGFGRLGQKDGMKRQSAVEFRFRKRNEGNALFRQLSRLLRGCRTVDGALFSLTVMDLPCLFGKARADVFKVLLDVVMDVEQHFFELSGRRRCRRRRRRLLYLFRRSRLFFFDMDGAGMGHLLYPLAAACRTRDQLLFRLLLKIFKARKPAFKLMVFLADKVVDDHTIPQSMNKFVLAGCQGSRALRASWPNNNSSWAPRKPWRIYLCFR